MFSINHDRRHYYVQGVQKIEKVKQTVEVYYIYMFFAISFFTSADLWNYDKL